MHPTRFPASSAAQLGLNNHNDNNDSTDPSLRLEDCDEKRLDSLSNRISNLKMQYQGILSSRTLEETQNTDYNRSGINASTNQRRHPRRMDSPLEIQSPSLSLALDRKNPDNYLYHENLSLDSSNLYLRNTYEPSSIDNNLDVQYSSLPYSSNVSPTSLLSVTRPKSNSSVTSPSKSLTHVAGQHLSKRAASAASYLLGSPSAISKPNSSMGQMTENDLKQSNLHNDAMITTTGISSKSIDLKISSYQLPNDSFLLQNKPINSFHNAEYGNANSNSSSVPSATLYSDYYYDSPIHLNVSSNPGPSISPIPSDFSNLSSGCTINSSESLLDPAGSSSLGSFSSHYCPYFKETVEDLGPEEYRWFYKTESDKKWVPFIGYDSLRIEWKFRDLQQNGLAGPLAHPQSLESIAESGASGGNEDDKSFEVGEDGTVTVRGGLYEVDVRYRRGQSIYWKGKYHNLLYNNFDYINQLDNANVYFENIKIKKTE